MKDRSASCYGAPVERGTITSVSGDTCVISSYDRYGLTVETTLPSGYTVNDRVLYLMFDDGEAVILKAI